MGVRWADQNKKNGSENISRILKNRITKNHETLPRACLNIHS